MERLSRPGHSTVSEACVSMPSCSAVLSTRFVRLRTTEASDELQIVFETHLVNSVHWNWWRMPAGPGEMITASKTCFNAHLCVCLLFVIDGAENCEPIIKGGGVLFWTLGPMFRYLGVYMIYIHHVWNWSSGSPQLAAAKRLKRNPLGQLQQSKLRLLKVIFLPLTGWDCDCEGLITLHRWTVLLKSKIL